MCSLKSTDGIVRPLLAFSKERIKDYANANKIVWREDSTNQDTRYKRNQIRHNILPRLTTSQREQLRILTDDLTELNQTIDTELDTLLHVQPSISKLDRNWYIGLPHIVSREVLHHWLRRHAPEQLDRRRIEQLVIIMKTGRPNTSYHLNSGHIIELTKKHIALKNNSNTPVSSV